jgi:TonB family protein
MVPVDLAQYTGLGVPQSIAAPAPVVQETAAEDPGFAYTAEVLDVEPLLLNMNEVIRSMERLYPRLLLQAGISGMTVLRFVVQPDGKVDISSIVVVESTTEEFADASRRAVETFRFQPGIFRGQNVRSLVQMPITWQPGN